MGTYAYRAYIETLLNYDVSAKKSQFTSALYYKDTPGHMDKVGSLPAPKGIKIRPIGDDGNPGTEETVIINTAGTGNQGFAKRSEFIRNGKQFVLSGPIFSDIFMNDRLLLNMVDLKVVLNRSSPKFCLMDLSGDSNKPPTFEVEPEVKLTDVILKI